MANGIESLDPNLWEKIKRLMNPIDDKGRMKTGGMNMSPEDARFAAELGLDFTPGVGDVKALLYDMPRSLRDARNAPTPLGKAGHAGLATLAGLSAIPFFGKPFDFLRAALKARKAKKILSNRKAMDLKVFHGTARPMDANNPWEYLEPSPGGMRGPGIYTTTNPTSSSTYADLLNQPSKYGPGAVGGNKWQHSSDFWDVPFKDIPGVAPRVYPGVVRSDKLADLSEVNDMKDITPEKISRLVDKFGEGVRPPKSSYEGIRSGPHYRDYFQFLAKRNKYLEDLGYEGIRSHDEVVLFDPRNLKSPWAKFEDMKSKDMLSSLVGPTLLGAGMAARATRDRENYVERYRDGGIVSLFGRDK